MNKKIDSERLFRNIIGLIYIAADMLLILTMQRDRYWLFCSCVLLVFSVLVAWMTLDRRIPKKIWYYTIMICVMANNFIDSIVHENIYYVIIVLFGCCALFSIFKDEILILIHGVCCFLLIVYHVAFAGSIDVSVPQEMRIAVLSCLGMLGITGYSYAYIRKQKKNVEKLKSLAETAMEAEHSKSDFLANMSHEIRTPMNAIVGMCELILRESDISSTVREYCFNIQSSGRSLLAIINDILDFSKIESGKMELIEEEFNLASTLNDVINMALARMGDKKLELVVRVDPDIPQGLLGDEIRIRQIIINLVTNAVKYTPEGVVVIKVSQTRHDYGINLSISVKDSGVGITQENLEKLFVSFQQVDTKKNRSVEGTGLGLAISKRLITQMGGFINVSSEYGKGSEFKVVLPLKVKDAEPFISVKSEKPVFAAAYFDLTKFHNENVTAEYKKQISEIGDQLHIPLSVYKTFDRLKARIDRGGLTHCFIGREEYLSEKAYFEKLAQHIEVVIIQDRLNAAPVPAGMKCIYKPFYALPVAAVLSNESVVQNFGEAKRMSVNFTAPKARVLVVDDNITNLQVAEGLMRPYHMQVITAESGSEAIRLLQSKDIDLIFMDHMMPEMDGVETTEKIRQMEGDYYKNIPIVALTANAVGGAKKMFLSSGFQDFVSKPIELSALDKVLKRWLPKQLQVKVTTRNADAALEEEKKQDIKLKEDERMNGLIDIKVGLFYTGGNAQAYIDILSSYIKRGRDKLERIRTLYECKDWKNYVIEVHALKSSSLSVGAKNLSELAKELELAGKDAIYSTIDEKTEPLLELYGKVIKAGEQYLSGIAAGKEAVPSKKEEYPEIEEDRLLEIVKAIGDAGENFDSEGMTKACREASKYAFGGKPLKPYFDKVTAYIDDFEYEKACKEAFHISEQFKGQEVCDDE